ncbi:MAG: ester cyclase [Candidatus Promineifilaceae bacterium]|nr:ester cyclase [Candidatus Promineifilaceae bacterium]
MDSTEAENKETVRRATEAFNRLDRQSFDACFANPCLYHFPARSEDRSISYKAHWELVLGNFRVFPDLEASIDSLIAEDNRVFVRWSYVGTHLGKGKEGVEPSGERIDWGICWVEFRFEDGLIAEAWEICDLAPV